MREHGSDSRIIHDVPLNFRNSGRKLQPKADQKQVATILAHIGWAQVLRVRNKLPVFLNVDSVFCPAEADRPPTRDTHENAEQSMKL